MRAAGEGLIASAAFKSSKRCQLLLIRIVEHSLADDSAPPLRGARARRRGARAQAALRHPRTIPSSVSRLARSGGGWASNTAIQPIRGMRRINLPAGHYAVTFTGGTAPSGGAAGGAAGACCRGSASQQQRAAAASSAAHRRRGQPAPSGAARASGDPHVEQRALAFETVLGSAVLNATQPVLVCTGAIDIAHISGRMWEAASAPDRPGAAASRDRPTRRRCSRRNGVRHGDRCAGAGAGRVAVPRAHQALSHPHEIAARRSRTSRASPTVLVGMFNNVDDEADVRTSRSCRQTDAASRRS